jgi:uncharacterized glyoxalase superfamily protein PhnB
MTASSVPARTVWPALVYDDAHAAIRFLGEAFGFEQRLLVPGVEEGHVAHAELVWPEGGGVMLGTTNRLDSIASQRPAGVAATYVVTDQPDALFGRAMAAGAELVHGLSDEDYGSRGFAVRDPEGNIWSFGTYRGAESG